MTRAPSNRPTWKRYGLALLLVLLSAPPTVWLRHILPQQNTFIAFSIAVLLSAWYGGWGPGLVATFLSAGLANYLFFEPVYSIAIQAPADIVKIVLFVLFATSLTFVIVRLSDARRRLRLAVNATGVGIFDWQPGVLMRRKPDWATAHGLQAIIGRVLPESERIHPEDAEAIKRLLHEAFANRSPNLVREVRILGPDDSVRWLAIRMHVYYGASGSVARLVGTTLDVTVAHKREEERERLIKSEHAARIEAEQARTALASSNEELQRFAYAVSHDLQQPLRNVAIHTELLVKRNQAKFDSRSLETASVIVEAVRELQKLIDSVLTYSRISEGRSPEVFATDAGFVLNLALQHLSSSIAEARAQITCDPLPAVLANDSQLLQVFLNLLSNAIKYRSQAPLKIHVSAKQDGGTCCFSLSDNGIGIDSQYHERVFGFLQKLHPYSEYQGIGIGLALVKRIIERHGGSVWVESQPGQGATFFFTLPLAAGTPESRQLSQASSR